MRKAFRRSLFAARDIQEGEVFSEDMIVMKRPGNGVNPNRINEFIGRVARQNIKKDKMLSGDDLSGAWVFVSHHSGARWIKGFAIEKQENILWQASYTALSGSGCGLHCNYPCDR